MRNRDHETPEDRLMPFPQNYRCRTEAGIRKRIERAEMLIKNIEATAWYKTDTITLLKRNIEEYLKQLDNLPLKRKRITL